LAVSSIQVNMFFVWFHLFFSALIRFKLQLITNKIKPDILSFR
jgi:hypothetical protein